jgi:hypothetical protein
MPGFSIAAPNVEGPLARLSVVQAGAPPQASPLAPAAPPPPAFQGTSISGLRDQASDLRVQLAGLQAEWNGLSTQLGRMRIDNPARPPVQAKAADIGVQIAQVEGQLARVQEQIAVRTGRTYSTVPPNFRRSGPDPDVIVDLSFVLLLVVALPFAIAFARRLGRGGRAAQESRMDPMMAPRLERIEQAVDAIAIEVERISEGQRFVTRLLAERPKQASGPEGAEPAAVDGQLRALGAGPMQEIHTPQRQSVRTSNTPH